MYFGVPPGPFTAFPHQKAFHQGAGGRVFRIPLHPLTRLRSGMGEG